MQEIQDLPLSQMHKHMKRYGFPRWGDVTEDSKDEAVQYNVTVRLESVEYSSFHVRARDKEEAEDLAAVHIESTFDFDDYQITTLEEG